MRIRLSIIFRLSVRNVFRLACMNVYKKISHQTLILQVAFNQIGSAIQKRRFQVVREFECQKKGGLKRETVKCSHQ